MKIMFAGGGTAGHVNPAIAVAKFILERQPASEIRFVGTKTGLENKLVPKEGFAMDYIDVEGFRRKLSFKNFGAAAKAVRSVSAARRIIKAFAPDVIVGTGGYVSAPVLYAGTKLGIPTAIHESNAFPGMVTRFLAKRVDRVMINFPDSARHFKHKGKLVVVGNPMREDIVYGDKAAARFELGLRDKPFVLSFGGSLGAREFNKSIIAFIALHSGERGIAHTHATGSYGFRWVPDKLREAGVELERCPDVSVVEYIYNMPQLMSAADLVISRAGANTLCELMALGKPAILVPSPNVTNNHQFHNAMSMANRGGAVVIEEKKLNGKVLYDTVMELIDDPDRLQKMGEAAQAMAILDATQKIYDIIFSLKKGRP